MPKIIYESELCHHGVKGMKWGIRKQRPGKYRHRNRNANIDRYKRAKLLRDIGVTASAIGMAASFLTGAVPALAIATIPISTISMGASVGGRVIQMIGQVKITDVRNDEIMKNRK